MSDPKTSGTPPQPQRQQPHSRPTHLELPTPSSARPHSKPQNPLHLLPATALFHGPHAPNGFHSAFGRARDDRTPPTPADRAQYLPRAHPPTASFSGSSRPIVLRDSPDLIPKPPVGQRNTKTQANAAVAAVAASRKPDDFRADAVWAEMQKTLADVELSAMNSSHVFGATHAKALEDLRTAQLGLAQAWAKSEADEMIDEEFGRDENETGTVGQSRSGLFGGHEAPGSGTKGREHDRHSRQGSYASGVSGGLKAVNMEEETERDIRLARRRREANDRYFKQVNRGVLDVVKKLDDVTTAMRRVEKESREIWNESSGSEDLGDVTDTDQSAQEKAAGEDGRTGRPRAETHETVVTMGTGSDFLLSSPESKR